MKQDSLEAEFLLPEHVSVRHTASGAGNMAVLRDLAWKASQDKSSREQLQLQSLGCNTSTCPVADGTCPLRGLTQVPLPYGSLVSPEKERQQTTSPLASCSINIQH